MFKYLTQIVLNMGDKKLHFFIVDIILLIVFLGLIKLIFSTLRVDFIAELFLVTLAILISFIALLGFYNKKKWSAILLYFVFLFTTLNILLFYYHGKTLLGTLLLSTLGMLIALAYIRDPEPEIEFEPVTEEFTPGKYIASKSGTTYHAPKCDWALKIKEANQVWLESDAEAKKKGYKKHSCLD